ncbi:MAG: hypothetical protein ACYDGN_09120 [Acidimicrobiales bacterium]
MTQNQKKMRYRPRKSTLHPTDLQVVEGGPVVRSRTRHQPLLYVNGHNDQLSEGLRKYLPAMPEEDLAIFHMVQEQLIRQVEQLQPATISTARNYMFTLAQIHIDTWKRLYTHDVNDVLDLANIKTFVDIQNAERPSHWKATVRSRLELLAEVLAPNATHAPRRPGYPRKRAIRPLTVEEELAYAEHACSLVGPLRGRRMLIIALGLGSGVTGSICCYLDHESFVRRPDGQLAVRIPRRVTVNRHGEELVVEQGRVVPIRGSYQAMIAEALEEIGDAPLLGQEYPDPGVITTALQAFHSVVPGTRLTLAQIRSTWFCRLLESDVPISWVRQWAGVRSIRHLSDLIEFVGLPDEGVALERVAGS